MTPPRWAVMKRIYWDRSLPQPEPYPILLCEVCNHLFTMSEHNFGCPHCNEERDEIQF